MALRKLLSVNNSVFARNVLPFKKNTGDIATRSAVVYTPPTVRISFGEKMILGLILSVSIMAVPAWVAYNIPRFQGETKVHN